MSRWACLLLLLLLLLAGGEAKAQPPYQPIAYDEEAQGEISSADYHQLFAFNGRQGDVITAEMSAPEGNLDPYLLLLDAGGQVLASSDDEGAGRDARIELYRLPAEGQYFLVATRYGQELGLTTGSYRLTLLRQGVTVSAGAVLAYGDQISGEVSSSQPRSVYFFQAHRGEVVNVSMRRTSQNLDPYLILANEQREILVQQDDDPTQTRTLDAAIVNYVIPHTGLYIVVATRYGQEAGTSAGRFLLTLERTPNTERGMSFATALLLDYGAVLAGSITADVPQRYYRFEGQRGDVISIDMERSTGNLATFLRLLDSNQQELAAASNPNNPRAAQIASFSLPADGSYTIMATRVDAAAGSTEGDFELRLNGRAGIMGSSFLELVYGATVEGSISAEAFAEGYVFYGQAGEVISASMTRLSGDLDPLLTLYYDNKQIAFDDDSGEENNALLRAFRLPEDGIYHLEASRFDREQGRSTGTYRLSLSSP